jgi:hypothetical protein
LRTCSLQRKRERYERAVGQLSSVGQHFRKAEYSNLLTSLKRRVMSSKIHLFKLGSLERLVIQDQTAKRERQALYTVW